MSLLLTSSAHIHNIITRFVVKMQKNENFAHKSPPKNAFTLFFFACASRSKKIELPSSYAATTMLLVELIGDEIYTNYFNLFIRSVFFIFILQACN